jgi:hypothetical protein
MYVWSLSGLLKINQKKTRLLAGFDCFYRASTHHSIMNNANYAEAELSIECFVESSHNH